VSFIGTAACISSKTQCTPVKQSIIARSYTTQYGGTQEKANSLVLRIFLKSITEQKGAILVLKI
jgi:hypothetical protein